MATLLRTTKTPKLRCLKTYRLYARLLVSQSISTNVNTYQATVAPQPVVPYFLPGQAPVPPPKPKLSRPRAPRKKKDQQFSERTSKFKISGVISTSASGPATLTGTIPANSVDTSPSASSGTTSSITVAPSMTPASSQAFGYANDDSSTSVTRYHRRLSPGGPSIERSRQTPAQRTHSASPGVGSARPLRMVTLLIEDMRGGVSDPQLAEVRVPLKVADDPDDGFWADAAEVPAKVYTMRGRFRQFFMRVDQFDQLQVQSAHIGVSKQRTLNVFVEAPVPQGQLPRPRVPPSDVRPSYHASSEREAVASRRPSYSLATREDQIERLSRSSYAVQSRSYSPVSESGSYGRSQRTASPHRSQHDPYANPSRRRLTPPIPGRQAEMPEERDEAIANYIRSRIENHPKWMEYMQAKARPQRVSEVLKQYAFVEDRVREFIGRKTPTHWDGAPNSYVEKHHVWRVLNLDPNWGEECQAVSLLVGFYGDNGSRYEDSRVVDMINDASLPKANTMERFLRLLRHVDEGFTRDAIHGEFEPMSTQD
ncbi:hypothetical protein JVT61DRAFT_3009 [Boletus reticuloceps]|uniref:Uncharacterized protein n=1 Tax=Boletus reticuloceps TaxID=495285 RepID=A0A8I3A890_9AGAM|nr:hypothetical protein JVT61DRAFT_3009 [Boletus reticuloceps]